MELKRYFLESKKTYHYSYCLGIVHIMSESPNGEYVRHEDFKTILEKVLSVHDELTRKDLEWGKRMYCYDVLSEVRELLINGRVSSPTKQ